uniref:Uncharacterized protein AlNc14C149G7479 n=1 Tax=Albugo laibachii Nc14 TaxID=890382 RepID=F0WLW5_9STRA|nr:conserved hypothetical protein [Albugo laibachii Nc14]|eukprot:CCA22292.1 conserved hypothetical protein [Albugo laibachii Nc14]
MKDLEDEPLFMELSRSDQQKRGGSTAFLSRCPGDILKDRLDLYRRTILFHIHAKLDDVTYLEIEVLEHKQNINAKDELGRTALHYACHYGAGKAVRFLLQQQALIDEADSDMRWTALHYASLGGYERIVKSILTQAPAADITQNRKDKNGTTPLMLAAGENHSSAVNILLQMGTHVNATDNEGWTALHYATAKDAALTAEVLIRYKADTNMKILVTNETPLELSYRLNSSLVGRQLVEAAHASTTHAKAKLGL